MGGTYSKACALNSSVPYLLDAYLVTYNLEAPVVWRRRDVDAKALVTFLNHLTPNGHYMDRTAQLTSRCCILYIYSTNIGTEYF